LFSRLNGEEEKVEVIARDHEYQVLKLPALGAWEAGVLAREH
jgi:hypothetical protein